MEATDASRLVSVVVVSYQEYSLTGGGGEDDFLDGFFGFSRLPTTLLDFLDIYFPFYATTLSLLQLATPCKYDAAAGRNFSPT